MPSSGALRSKAPAALTATSDDDVVRGHRVQDVGDSFRVDADVSAAPRAHGEGDTIDPLDRRVHGVEVEYIASDDFEAVVLETELGGAHHRADVCPWPSACSTICRPVRPAAPITRMTMPDSASASAASESLYHRRDSSGAAMRHRYCHALHQPSGYLIFTAVATSSPSTKNGWSGLLILFIMSNSNTSGVAASACTATNNLSVSGKRIECDRHVQVLPGRDVLQTDALARSALVVEVHDDPCAGRRDRAIDKQRVFGTGLIGGLDGGFARLGGDAEVTHGDHLRELLAVHEVRTVGAHLLVHHVEVVLAGLAAVGVNGDDDLGRGERP